MMNDIPPTLQEQLAPLFFKKDVYSGKLCEKGKEIRRLQLELMKRGEPISEGRRPESESKPKVCEQARPQLRRGPLGPLAEQG